MVLQPDAPQISLSGVGPHLARPAPEFEGPRGVPLFPELRIVCSLSHAVNTAAQGMEGGGEQRYGDLMFIILEMSFNFYSETGMFMFVYFMFCIAS